MMTTIYDLPNELLLDIFTFLPIKSILAARTVDRKWRDLIQYAHIHPVRKKYIALFDELINSSTFLDSREHTNPTNLEPFDREAYIRNLEYVAAGSGGEVPEEFKFYILEWPTKLILGHLWPGDQTIIKLEEDNGLRRLPLGRCALRTNIMPEPLLTATYMDQNRQRGPDVCVLVIWHLGMNHIQAMVMDHQVDGLFGTTHIIHDCFWEVYESTTPMNWIGLLKGHEGLG